MSDTQDVKSTSLVAMQLRQLRGFETQSAFAKRLGISRDSLANYETGRTVPSAAKLDQFREALGLGFAHFQEHPAAQMMSAFGQAGEPDFRPSPDELAFIRLIRIVPRDTVLAVAMSLLDAISTGLLFGNGVDGEKFRQAVERLALVVKERGTYDRSKLQNGADDALRQAQAIARQAINRRD